MQLSDPARSPKSGDDSLIPLINVVFLMLVFFMIAGQILPADAFKVTPPAASVEQAAPRDALVVLVAADGRIAVDGEEVAQEQLAARLEELLAPPAAQQSGQPAGSAMAPGDNGSAPPAAGGSELASQPAASPLETPQPTQRKVALKVDGQLKASDLNEVLDALRAAGVNAAQLFTVRSGSTAS